MDPQSVSFTPQSDIWRLTMTDTLRTVQATQQEHAERLMRLERRHDGDARIKSVWGGASPFPSGLSGTPQIAPRSGSHVDFNDFEDDDEPNNMVRSLHLDGDEEPRRGGAASRANSVRFDESAKWNHGSRSSVDMLSRTPSTLGGLGHPMFERTTSHKSDGRQSSAGHSASGRANSLGLESSQMLSHSSSDLAGMAPGLAILGNVPSIIRCWVNMNFKHDALLYAAICTGSFKSWIDVRLLETLHLVDQVRMTVHGTSKIRLPVYLPEAVSHPVSSRPNSPAPQLPSIMVDFNVMARGEDDVPEHKTIQLFLGSDVLQQRQGDVLFSTNVVALYDDDRNRLSIPLVRPENDEIFKNLSLMNSTTTAPASKRPSLPGPLTPTRLMQDSIKSLTNGSNVNQAQLETQPSPVEIEPAVLLASSEQNIEQESNEVDSEVRETQDQEQKPSLPALNTTRVERDVLDDSQPMSSSSRTSTSPAVWSNWRTGGSTSGETWASTSARISSGTYQRPTRELGIKVLKPSTSRQSSRPSGTALQSATPQSRFFDDGRRRAVPGFGGEDPQLRRTTSGEAGIPVSEKGAGSVLKDKTRTGGNPIGGASAFGWLTSGQK